MNEVIKEIFSQMDLKSAETFIKIFNNKMDELNEQNRTKKDTRSSG